MLQSRRFFFLRPSGRGPPPQPWSRLCKQLNHTYLFEQNTSPWARTGGEEVSLAIDILDEVCDWIIYTAFSTKVHARKGLLLPCQELSDTCHCKFCKWTEYCWFVDMCVRAILRSNVSADVLRAWVELFSGTDEVGRSWPSGDQGVVNICEVPFIRSTIDREYVGGQHPGYVKSNSYQEDFDQRSFTVASRLQYHAWRNAIFNDARRSVNPMCCSCKDADLVHTSWVPTWLLWLFSENTLYVMGFVVHCSMSYVYFNFIQCNKCCVSDIHYVNKIGNLAVKRASLLSKLT